MLVKNVLLKRQRNRNREKKKKKKKKKEKRKIDGLAYTFSGKIFYNLFI